MAYISAMNDEETKAMSDSETIFKSAQKTGAEAAKAAAGDDPRTDLIGLDKTELTALMASLGEKPFRAKQVWHWLYHRGVTDIGAMTNLSKPFRDKLAEHCVIRRPEMVREQTSADTTRKWLMRFADGTEAEAVYIPDTGEPRGAVCLSTQVGCTLTCRFCHTGTQTLVRNLTAGEIVGQFMVARDSYAEWPTPTDDVRRLSNIVVMGMGEPLFNTDNVIKALKIAMDPEGIALSRRRITLSTSGVVPGIRRLSEELPVNLAISLHAATDEVRDQIMPINKKWPLKELIAALRDFDPASNARRITLEYIMLKDVNDSDADARELARLIKGLPVKFNLIPFNPWPGSPYEPSSRNRIARFVAILNEAGYSAPVREPRGQDIMAACGQLKSASEREKASRHKARVAAGIEDEHSHRVA